MATLTDSTNLTGTITLTKASGTKVTFDTDKKYITKDIELTINAPTTSASASGLTVSYGTGWITGGSTTCSDANLIAGNIKKDISIFGITGTYDGIECPIFHANVDNNWTTLSNITCNKTYSECLALFLRDPNPIDYGFVYVTYPNNSIDKYTVTAVRWGTDQLGYIFTGIDAIAFFYISYYSNGTLEGNTNPIPYRTSSDLTASGPTVTAPWGYYDDSATITLASASPTFTGGTVSGTATASATNASISSSTNNSGVSIAAAASATRGQVTYNGAVNGWVSKSNGAEAIAAGSATALTGTTYYINGVTLTKPTSGTKTFSVTVPNGATTATFVFNVDTSGNVTITES